MRDRLFIILAGGEIKGETADIPEGAFVICADKGYIAARDIGIVPQCVIGDFDSLGFVPKGDEVRVYPSKKDDTDTMLAARYAISAGAKEIHIYGALGGRLDHTLANVQTLMFLAENGVSGMLIGENNRISIQTGRSVRYYKRREGWYFSLLSYSEKCTGVCINGAEYELSGAELINSNPLGVSNHIISEYAEVSLESGSLLVIESRDA